jgi:hypothetical protein
MFRIKRAPARERATCPGDAISDSLDPGIREKTCKKARRSPFQLPQPSSTDTSQIGERRADCINRKQVESVPTIEHYSVRVSPNSDEESAE